MKIRTWILGLLLLTSGAQALAVTGGVAWVGDSQFQTASCDEGCDMGCCDGVDCGDGCDCGAGVGGRGGLLGAIEGFTLAGLLGLDDESWLEVGGWTQFGYHDEQTPLSQTRGDVLAFNDVPDDVNLHQQWFYLGHTADGSEGLDIGFRGDFIYGTDAQKTQAFGNDPTGGEWDIDWDHGVYGWAIPQAYVELAAGDFAAKVGHFFTVLGYEVVPATGNFFYSHALTMFNSEPFTHTGVLGTYSGVEGLTLYGGWTAGWDTGFASSNSGSNIISGFAAQLTDSVSFTYLNTYGNFGLRGAGFDPTAPNSDDDYSHSIVLNAGVTDKLSYIFQTDYVRIDNAAAGYWDDDLGINQYLIYNYSDSIGLGTRAEWWKDEGVSHYEVTTGVNVKPISNLVIRPEYRRDWVPTGNFEQDMFGMDMILTY